MSQVQLVRGRIVGERKILGNGIGGGKLLGGNQGILADLPATVERARSTVQQRVSTITAMRPLERISAPPVTEPASPLDLQQPLLPAKPTKRGPAVGGRSDGGGRVETRPVIGGT
jgi:hypothetical protein